MSHNQPEWHWSISRQTTDRRGGIHRVIWQYLRCRSSVVRLYKSSTIHHLRQNYLQARHERPASVLSALLVPVNQLVPRRGLRLSSGPPRWHSAEPKRPVSRAVVPQNPLDSLKRRAVANWRACIGGSRRRVSPHLNCCMSASLASCRASGAAVDTSIFGHSSVLGISVV